MLITTLSMLRQQTRSDISVLAENILYQIGSARRRRTDSTDPTLLWCGATFPLHQASEVEWYGTTLYPASQAQAKGIISTVGRISGPKEVTYGFLQPSPQPHEGSEAEQKPAFPGNYLIAPEGFYQLEEHQRASWQERNVVQLGERHLEVMRYSFSIDDLVEAEEQAKKAASEPPKDQQPYMVTFTDAGASNHFSATMDMVGKAVELAKDKPDDIKKAKAIYDFIDQSVKYARGFGLYSTAAQVFFWKQGNCAETTALFVSMARSVGLRASYATVHVDCHGKNFTTRRVGHACAALHTPERDIHIDNAYHRFDAKHRKIEVVEDYNAIKRLASWTVPS